MARVRFIRNPSWMLHTSAAHSAGACRHRRGSQKLQDPLLQGSHLVPNTVHTLHSTTPYHTSHIDSIFLHFFLCRPLLFRAIKSNVLSDIVVNPEIKILPRSFYSPKCRKDKHFITAFTKKTDEINARLWDWLVFWFTVIINVYHPGLLSQK